MQRTDESSDMVPSEEGARLRKEAVAWVIRLHRGGMSPEDRRAFDAWQAKSLAHARMFQKVFAVWDCAELRAAAAVAAAEPSLFNVRPCSVNDASRPCIVEGTETAVRAAEHL